MHNCPICNAHLQPTLGPVADSLDAFKVTIGIVGSVENELLRILIDYWQWLAEGSKNKKKNPDVFDKYYKGLKYEKKKNEYFFKKIQVANACLSGAFKVDPGFQIRILRKRAV